MKKKQLTIYNYTAYDAAGVLVKGVFSAKGRGEVLDHILSKGLKPMNIEEDAHARGLSDIRLFERIELEDVLFFARNLATSLRMGVPATEALALIIEDTEKHITQDMLRAVLTSIRGGSSFTAAFRPYEKHFPPMFLGMLEAGERSGQLDQTLMLFADYVERSHEFRGKVRSALMYPLVVVTGSILVSLLVIVFMVPRLSRIFTDAQVELPFITRLLVSISDTLTYSYTLDAVVLVALIATIVWALKTDRGRHVFDTVAVRAPLTKDIVRKTITVRITRTLATLLPSGVSILDALTLAGRAGGNAVYNAALLRIKDAVMAGQPIATAFSAESQYFPKLFIGLLAIGERTGKLADTLKSVADFYERDIDERLKRLTSLIEPIMLVILGLVVGAIALAVLLPIYQLVGAVR
ncbi:hypothetical protein A3C87_00710 [Candidatus Kaiserbacteria bacterium RIFCSPHIGHO2_02_FULL_49_34]|uniref:Type II secretion system protein GspF domain-containing protein n=1 Tax=Candidatus Kaiserbacteria bacterium RIFCSPHIGHO2_02_FULL_49_34 TaxID=1798491 RepID=A0A1F6DLM1_9BACT|nr:MAG: hypothetical protein A3C87_00710 [Candidatus Kaiserbacteria bacterium RIFCSPHIGHO2_02_FULL_49_34]